MIWFWPVIYRHESLRGILLENNPHGVSYTMCHVYVASRGTDCLLLHMIIPRMFKWHATVEDILPVQSKGETCLELGRQGYCFTAEQRASLPTDHLVRFGVRKFSFPLSYSIPAGFCVVPLGLEGKENCHKYANAHATCCAVMKAIVSDPGVS